MNAGDSNNKTMVTSSNEKSSEEKKGTIHWFRHGLRLHDNPALLEALESGGDFYPIFIFDGEVAGTKTAGYNRTRFLLESLRDLDSSLSKHGGRLHVFFGDPVKVLPKIFQEWSIEKLTFEQDPEPVWTARDNAVKKLCQDSGVECVEKVSHTLWDPKEIINNNGGCPPLTYLLFNQVAQAVGDPPRPVDDPDFSKVNMPVTVDHDNKFAIPTAEKLGVQLECKEQEARVNNWMGGETQALNLFKHRVQVEEMAFSVGSVMPNQSYPDLMGPPLSMSAHLRFGCLSIRKLYWTLRDAYTKISTTKPWSTTSVVGQVMWREYFYTMSVNNRSYDKMESNPICLNIPWYEDNEKLQKWTDGETGYPWIDAIMKQLRHEGWIHHVARHAVSTFLTRGDLWISWVDGLKVFDRYLIDADWSVCAGNWMWMSSSAFEKVLNCPKCFCPVRYGKKLDPNGDYIRRYLPVLKDMPLRYLFEPWKAPKAVQEKAKCFIGVDYPKPMVDHNKASKECYNLMMDVKRKLVAQGPGVEHCRPSNAEEVHKFVWMPGCHGATKDHGSGEIDEDRLCDGLNDL
ncbi:hypothetical protein ACF0H5_008562 [Mactra antiquata]